ncbi:MAG: class I SAM-dependent methyltransferase [Anaerolineae bacterium]|nr:class I SAM-dependent methyltransferase [Anaerolineae bacterium]
MGEDVVYCDTGLGTTYERFALNKLLSHISKERQIKSVLEGPHDGMTGIAGLNSIVLALTGARVTVVLESQQHVDLAMKAWRAVGDGLRVNFVVSARGRLDFPAGSFDLVWNFNVLPRLPNAGAMIQTMTEISRRYVLIFVPNRANYGFWLHRWQHRVAKEPWEHGDIGLMDGEALARAMRAQGLRVLNTWLVDVPWWPDIADPGKLLTDFFPFLKPVADGARPERRYRWDVHHLPYFDEESYPDVHTRMRRLGFIERSRWMPLKRLFAHHVGVLAEKPDGMGA